MLRDAFNGISALKNIRCTKVRMYYCDADGVGNEKRDYQVLEFDLIEPTGQRTHKSNPIPTTKSLMVEAMKIAANL
jgi:hypothetical protein